MKVFHHLEELDEACAGGVCMTIGVFDAVHRGHQKLMERAREEAQSRGLKSLVFTFERHPLALLAPVYCPPTLTQPSQRAALIESNGIDLCLMLRFTPQIAQIPPESFVEDVLVRRCQVKFLITGPDFSFGAGGKGDVKLLRELSTSFGYEYETLTPIREGASSISSTRIRDMLLSGDVAGVVPMLQRHYSFEATVVTGDARGRQIGFPTANLIPEENQLVPADGVYAVRVHLNGTAHGGMLNIGTRPTFGGAGRTIEAHLFDFSGDLVARRVLLEFISRIRDEKKFGSVDELVAQLRKDEATSRAALAGGG